MPTYDELKQMQQLPLEAKILKSQRRIQEWYDHWEGQVYVSFSGGKDSTVLKHLVENTPGVHDVPTVFVDTGLEYPEVRKFATERADVVLRPEMRFDEVIKTYGYPVISKETSKMIKEARRALEIGNTEYYALQKLEGRLLDKEGNKSKYNCAKWHFMVDAPYKVSHSCCDVMKKRPLKKYNKETKRRAFTGTMASESQQRTAKWLQHGCNAFDKREPVSTPMSFWTEQDVLEYLRKYDLDYASVYGDIVETRNGLATTGCNRTGCMFCAFGCHMEKEPNRFQKLKETHPKQYKYCIGGGELIDGQWQPNKEGLGLSHVLDYIGVDYE